MNIQLFTEKKTSIFLLIFFALVFFIISYFSIASYDAGDGIRHYLVSRYSWKHPDLLLYSWGKPFFTIISSPFSQFGLLGINIFNILCGIGSAFFAFQIAKKLNLNYPLLAIPFLLFTPCYFPTINSGLTEPFFGFILISSIYLMFVDRYLLACILVSFLPFVRTEGNLILPLFFIVLLYRRKFLYSPLLAFGTFIYSVIGLLYFNDFFWVINQNPYNGDNKLFYGSGELLHFVTNYKIIWGSILGILFVLGLFKIISLGFQTIKNNETKNTKFPEELLLIYGAFAIYFVAHSIMWWKGLANSLGLIRVIAGIIPCSAIICLRGFNLIMIPFFNEKIFLKYSIIAATTFWIISNPFKQDYFPYKLDSEQAVVKDAGDWFKESQYTNQKVYYLYPLLAHLLNVDSFDQDKVGELWGLYPSIKAYGIDAIPDSSIVFWDAHFGPNECKIPLDTIMNDPNFELIKSIKPETEFTTLGGYKFEIYVFMKLNHPKQLDTIFVDNFDLETNNPLLINPETIVAKNAFSGNNSCKLSSEAEYSVSVLRHVSDFPKNASKFVFNSTILDIENKSKDASIVMSIDDVKGKNLFWSGVPLVLKNINDSTKWKTISAEFFLGINTFPPNATVKFYVWNKSKTEFYIDNLKITYLGEK